MSSKTWASAGLVRVVVAGSLGCGVLLLGGCDSKSNTRASAPAVVTVAAGQATPIVASEKPAPAESNPAGDIPDTQAFVAYTSTAGGYTLDAPEGWARSESGAGVQFVSALDGEQVALSAASAKPDAASARGAEAAALGKTGRAVQIANVQDVQLSGGPAVLISYASNSTPDAVTGKQVRLEDRAYLFYKNGQLATLTLWAPQGADNVDQWLRIANSFRWA